MNGSETNPGLSAGPSGLFDLLRAGVRKPARYLGAEFFPGGRKGPEAGDFKVALVYPDLYEVGMSNTGLRILYSLLSRLPGVFVDLVFAPWPDMEAALEASGRPLSSRGFGLPLSQFDLLGISLQYELNYTNILTILKLGGIPFRAAQRDGRHPLVVGGGPCASHPEPVADFFDLFIVGDGEESLQQLVARLRAARESGLPRGELLKELDELPEAYVPALHLPEPSPAGYLVHATTLARRATVAQLDSYPPFVEFPVPAVETIFDRISLELARGCHQGCRFCEAGFTYRPPRERSPDYLVRWAAQTVRTTGYNEVSLASLSSADYSRLLPLVGMMTELATCEQVGLTLSSLRAYGVPDEVLEAVTSARISSLTLAPEAGSQRLRDLVNKNVTQQQILTAIGRVVARGINRIKLYFMVGLPTETDGDLDELVRLVHDSFRIVKSRFGGKAALVASVSMFVPRPHTPLQWEGMESLAVLKERVVRLRARLPGRSVQLKWHNPDMSWLEAILTRGDRRLGPAIEAAWRNGARFDSWDEMFNLDSWQRALAECAPDPAPWLGPLPFDGPLPWSHVATGTSEAFLRRERERAQAGATTVPCRPFGAGFDCRGCGAGCRPEELADAQGESGPVGGDGCLPVLPAGRASDLAAADSAGRAGRTTLPERRLRITFSKGSEAVLLGHLDLLRQLTLIFRRAGIPLALSRGFNPRPRFYFPPPLPLGHFGLEEPAEVMVAGPVEPARLAAQLNEVTIPGLTFLSAQEVEEGDPLRIGRALRADYLIAIGNPEWSLERWPVAQGEQPLCPHLLAAAAATRDHPGLPPLGPDESLWSLTWAMVDGPRIDRRLSELLPDLAIRWVARERLQFGPAA